jgi:hypothetical protein
MEPAATLTARTLTVLDPGMVDGAWYNPVALTVPTVAFPPAESFTYQVTTVFCVFFTVAANCCEPPSGTDAGDGVTVTEICPVDPAFTVTAFGWLTTPPGSGFATVTLTEPIWAVVAVPVAVSEVDET